MDTKAAIRAPVILGCLLALGWQPTAPAAGSPDHPPQSAPPAMREWEAPHGLKIAVKMIGPVTQETELQIICLLKHNPAGDQYLQAMQDLNLKLGGLLSGLRDRREYIGDVGETLLLSPANGTIRAKRLLLIGVGEEKSLTLDTLRLAGRIAIREAARLGATHVSFAPTLRDQGSSRIEVGDGDRAVAEAVILAYDTEKRLQAQALSPAIDITDFTIEAGPTYFDSVATEVGIGVGLASRQVQQR